MTSGENNKPVFPSEAVYYDCQDSEYLTHESPEEAVEDRIDALQDGETPIADIIAKLCPLEVRCFVRGEISEAEIQQRADGLLEIAVEGFEEEYGSPDGDHEALGVEDVNAVRPAFIEAVRALAARATVWPCKYIGSVELDAAQVEAMMREHYPEFFEKDVDGDA